MSFNILKDIYNVAVICVSSPYLLYKKLAEEQVASIEARIETINFKNLAFQSNQMGVSKKEAGQKLIVSLTSYGRRVDDVFITVESLFQQSLKADKIILWLPEDEFTIDSIPDTLKMAMKRGLEVNFCKELKPFNKLIYSLRKFPNDLIVTVDDDVIYPYNTLYKLFKAYVNEPNIIHCHRGHKMQCCFSGKLKPYNKWLNCVSNKEASFEIFPTGVGGVLYFPGCFYKDILREDIFTKLTPNNDDVWFKAMSLLNGVKCKVVDNYNIYHKQLLYIKGSQENKLWSKNKISGAGNDSQIKAVFDYYKLYENMLIKVN